MWHILHFYTFVQEHMSKLFHFRITSDVALSKSLQVISLCFLLCIPGSQIRLRISLFSLVLAMPDMSPGLEEGEV